MSTEPDRPTARERLAAADLGTAWEAHAREWIAWARRPGHDSYERFHRDCFLGLVPPPGAATLDLGCGEGRLARDLQRLGHHVIGVDQSATMVGAAREAGSSIRFERADASDVPFADASFDLVIAFMSLLDMHDVGAVMQEVSRVLARNGRFCFAVVHPLSSAGRFASEEPDAPFVVEGSYLAESDFADSVARDGLTMTFVSRHRPVSGYTDAVTNAGLLLERLAEFALPDEMVVLEPSRRWQRVPLFLHGRAVKL